MTMDQEARALVQQLVDALAPLKQGAFTADMQAAPDTATLPRAISLGAMKAANAAAAAGTAGTAALAATAT